MLLTFIDWLIDVDFVCAFRFPAVFRYCCRQRLFSAILLQFTVWCRKCCGILSLKMIFLIVISWNFKLLGIYVLVFLRRLQDVWPWWSPVISPSMPVEMPGALEEPVLWPCWLARMRPWSLIKVRFLSVAWCFSPGLLIACMLHVSDSYLSLSYFQMWSVLLQG